MITMKTIKINRCRWQKCDRSFIYILFFIFPFLTTSLTSLRISTTLFVTRCQLTSLFAAVDCFSKAFNNVRHTTLPDKAEQSSVRGTT